MYHPRRFFEVWRKKGLRAAISISYNYVSNSLSLSNLKRKKENFVRSQLLVNDPATLTHALYVKAYRPFLERKIGSGIDVMDEDWDNLILLDSYRADYFQEHSSLKGELSTAISKANWSLEFVVENFQGSEYHDTVVVTSNQYYQRFSKLDESTFYTLINTNDTGNSTGLNPEKVTEAAVDAMEKYPNKRFIIHYMKPHAPHMGETSDELRNALGEDFDEMFKLYRRGAISKKTLQQSYLETIKIIEDEVKRLISKIDGKTVVSSDHGENLGEVQHGVHRSRHCNETPECRYVPWLEMEYDDRRNTTEDEPIGFDYVSKNNIEERLAALGYK